MDIVTITRNGKTKSYTFDDGNAAMWFVLVQAEKMGVVFPREHGKDDYSYTDSDIEEVMTEIYEQKQGLGFDIHWDESK